MLVFPQLLTGALAQYPIRKRLISRTVCTEGPGGHRIKLADPAGQQVEWNLHFENLTDDEASVLRGFHRECEGALHPFLFLDPTGNLLCWSESFTEKAWVKDPHLTVAPGIKDPLGGQRASTAINTAGVPQGIEQWTLSPPWFLYNMSVYIRGDGNEVAMKIGSTEQHFTGGERWQRISVSGIGQGRADGVAFRIEIAGGRQVDLFGMQAEPQPGASSYKRTGAIGSIYLKARFADGQLIWRSTGPGRHSCNFRIVSNADGF